MKKRKVAIIGHFGGNENFLDGQTVKTKILYDELLNATDWNIKKVDTYYKNHKPIKLLVEALVTLLTTRDVIILLSKNGMAFFFPILFWCSKVFRTRIYHDVIGGNLYSYVEKEPKFKNYLNSFKINWVETISLKKKLEKCGVYNCEVIPNFKRLNVLTEKNKYGDSFFRFCMFSRVMKEKGIEDAISAVQTINLKEKKIICELDIYGRIDDEYKNTFSEIMKTVTSAVKYKGTVPYDQSVNVIKDYYALLFPTFWESEGFPGTIIDAFSAGLPVIATDWNYNSEIVENNVNGILYPNDEIKDLKEAIEWAINHEEELDEMRNNSIITAYKYKPEKYIRDIISTIEKNSLL